MVGAVPARVGGSLRKGHLMGRERTLLERIAASGAGGSRRGRPQATTEEDLDALMDSVRRHLMKLVNARHEFSQALPDYGLPALTDMTLGSSDYVRAIQEAIRVTIDKYEPRLQRVRVTRVENEDAPTVLAFRVEGMLVGKSGQHKVFYETTMGGSGQFEVSD